MLNTKMRGKLFYILIPFLPFLLGLAFRFKELYIWLQEPDKYFYYGRPLLTSFDGYLYAKQALDFANGKVQSVLSISLIGVLEGYLSKLFGVYPENIDLYLTPILSSLVAFPVFYYWYKLKMPVVGFCGAITAALSPIYLVRTSIVRFDTDSLNLTLPMFSLLFFLLSVKAKPLWAGLAFLSSWVVLFLYEWWYRGHTYITVSMVGAYILFLTVESVLDKTSRKRALIYLILTLLLSLIAVIYKGINLKSLLAFAINRAKAWTVGLEQGEKGLLPNPNIGVIELKELGVSKLAEYTMGFEPVLYISIIGLCLLIIFRFRYIILMLPILAIGALSFFGASRFSMYLAPFLGMGIGFLYYVALWLINKHAGSFIKDRYIHLLRAGLLSLLVLLSAPWTLLAELRTPPILNIKTNEGYVKLGELTPKNAYILDWWDYGYVVQYLSNRRVFHASGFDGLRSLFIAKAYSSNSQSEAYNLINSIVWGNFAHIFQLSPKESVLYEGKLRRGEYLKEFPFPVYWTFNVDIPKKFGWIYYYGSWDFEKREGIKSPILQVYNCKAIGRNVFKCDQGVFDFNRGVYIKENNEALPLKAVIMRSSQGQISALPYRRIGFYVVVVQKGNKLARYVMNERAFNTAFVQMYILRNYDSKLFELVYDDFPYLVAYRVRYLREVQESETD